MHENSWPLVTPSGTVMTITVMVVGWCGRVSLEKPNAARRGRRNAEERSPITGSWKKDNDENFKYETVTVTVVFIV
jgi:hypothetical protein